MKRCPTCNQQFTDEWLTFCTTDGTSLVPVEHSREEPPPTIMSMPPSVSPLEQPTMDMPGAVNVTPPVYRPPQSSPGAVQPGWKVPPPPAYPAATDKNLAIVSLILGIVSMTVGWCCYFGVLTSPVAIGLGLYALSLIKKDPNKYGGKGLAIGGIVAGSAYFVFLAIFILIYGLSFLMSGLN
ncbi:MAG TPA: DUF4190 domain-containing protein [Pyrinomonadaceae bacterium]|nr:DUF4190 domain-containing protein [Pyrinomonadaceae bacterium]